MGQVVSRRALLPRWAQLADLLTIGLGVLSLVVFVTGGWRTSVLGLPLQVRSGWRPLVWAAVLALVRHAVVPRPNIIGHLRTAAGTVGRGGRSIVAFLVVCARSPGRELRGGGSGLIACLAVARDSWRAIAVAVAFVILRSIVVVWWDQAAFNSDHAVVGLMAKHLAEGRAFPLFFYGQSYMLGVQAWLAAPLFLVAGPSVVALELPLIAVNALVAALLIVLLRRELGLGQGHALAASVVFAFAPPATALGLVEANGGNVEVFLYVLLLWLLRARPALFGVAAAFGFVHREFTVYGVLALALLWVADGGAEWRRLLRRTGVALMWCTTIWLGVMAVKQWSSPLGPGTSVVTADLPASNLAEVATRTCWSPGRIPGRLRGLWTNHLDVLYGTGSYPIRRLGIESRTARQGWPGASQVMLVAFAAALLRLLWRRRPSRWVSRDTTFGWYLLLVGTLSLGTYGAVGCDTIAPDTLRYDLLGLLIVVGVAGLFFRDEAGAGWKVGGVVILSMWAIVSGVAHTRLLVEYCHTPPPNEARAAVDALVARGVARARGSYAVAYHLTFLANERVVIASNGPVRILAYQPRGSAADLPVVREEPCDRGVRLAGRYHLCPPDRTARE